MEFVTVKQHFVKKKTGVFISLDKVLNHVLHS
ncbi:MAG: hypothetical protein QT03_C0001G1104 [archaeon GW2011_AR10]|nr:MAG: hypothetical protein QT03_C0001G1104 [archaeon GW2011_AR10]